jgi:FkbM family methyltransferase
MTNFGRLVGPLLGRRRLQPLCEVLLLFAVRGMNLDASIDFNTNGERELVAHLVKRGRDSPSPWTVFDVGANEGDWSAMVVDVLNRAGINHTVWAFEPGRDPFARLAQLSEPLPTIKPQNTALGSEEGRAFLYFPSPGSGLASLYVRQGGQFSRSLGREEIRVTTVDAFVERNAVKRIDLLKLDVEGHELAVLQGAERAIGSGTVRAIQFEFGGTHIDSRVFLRDFYDVLSERFDLYRVLRDGIHPLGPWGEHLELFRGGNYAALRRDRSGDVGVAPGPHSDGRPTSSP